MPRTGLSSCWIRSHRSWSCLPLLATRCTTDLCLLLESSRESEGSAGEFTRDLVLLNWARADARLQD